MATSGSVDFSLSRDDIIKMAYQKIGVVGEGSSLATAQTTEGALMLNAIVKSWNASLGMPIWALDTVYVLPVTSTNEILIGASGGHATESFVQTTLTANSTASDTTIDVASVTGIANTYNIGVELDSGEMHWTTVSGAPAALVVTLASGVSTAASTGNKVYCYQTKSPRPLRLTHVLARSTDTTPVDTPVRIVTSHEWLGYTSKQSESPYPLMVTYEPRIDRGLLRVWPRWGSGDYYLVCQYHRPLEDFDGTSDTPDFPQEWYLPLVYELACTVAPNYGIPVQERYLLRKEADRWISSVSQGDYEEGSIQFVPSSDGMR